MKRLENSLILFGKDSTRIEEQRIAFKPAYYGRLVRPQPYSQHLHQTSFSSLR